MRLNANKVLSETLLRWEAQRPTAQFDPIGLNLRQYRIPYRAGGVMDIYPAYKDVWAENIMHAVKIARYQLPYPQVKILVDKITVLFGSYRGVKLYA